MLVGKSLYPYVLGANSASGIDGRIEAELKRFPIMGTAGFLALAGWVFGVRRCGNAGNSLCSC